MQVRPFSSLNEDEQQRVYKQVSAVPGLSQALQHAPSDPALDLGQQPGSLHFEPVDQDNLTDFIQVHNDAFRWSPHGAPTDAGEVGDQLKAAMSPEMHQIGYVSGLPAVALRLVVNGRQGDLDLLAVAPGFQGQGLGRRGLEQALRTLRAHGVEEVRLLVAETNTGAVELYRNAGFGHDTTFSTWLVGPPLFSDEAPVVTGAARD